MAKKHTDLSHSALKVEFDEIAAKAESKPGDYGLTAAIIDEIKAGSTDLGAGIDKQALKNAEAKAATTELNQIRKDKNALYAKVKRMAKDSGVSAAKLAEIGIEIDDAIKSKVAVFDPTDLVVSGASNGNNSMKWDKNGNKAGTIYDVEALIGDATDFIIVAAVTGSKFVHKNQKPGVKVTYRIRAHRGEDYSDYSNEATVYGN